MKDEQINKVEEQLRALRKKMLQTTDVNKKREITLKQNVLNSRLKLYRFQLSIKQL